jgi:hypothetical protein
VIRRRLWSAGVCAGLVFCVLPAAAQERVTLERAEDLPGELRRALAAGRPLVVMVSLDGCPFCRDVRDAHLGPLRDTQGQAVVQLDMRSTRAVTALDGTPTTHGALTRSLGASVAPVVLFIGPGGREVAPRLSGYMADFYSAYLDDRMAVALRAIKN